MSSSDLFANWPQKVLSALVLLLTVAFGARLAADWLAPVVPYLAVVICLLCIYRLVLGRYRR